MPFSKKYFLGGATSVRGWGRYEVSPLSGSGLPIPVEVALFQGVGHAAFLQLFATLLSGMGAAARSVASNAMSSVLLPAGRA